MNDVISLEKGRVERAVAAAIAALPRFGAIYLADRKLRDAAAKIASALNRDAALEGEVKAEHVLCGDRRAPGLLAGVDRG